MTSCRRMTVMLLAMSLTLMAAPRASAEPLSYKNADLIILTDGQVKYLGGERSNIQSRLADLGSGDVAVRPIALDLFGFAIRRRLEARFFSKASSATSEVRLKRSRILNAVEKSSLY